MLHNEILEALMFFVFSCSWYWSIAKMLRTRTATGKSLIFVFLTCTGYLFGISAKLLMWRETGELSLFLYFYLWNLAVISVDLMLVLYFSKDQRPVVAKAAGPPAGALPAGGVPAR